MTRTTELLMAVRRATSPRETYDQYMSGGEEGLATLIGQSAVESASPTELVINDTFRSASSATKAIIFSDYIPSESLSGDARRYADSYLPDSYSLSTTPDSSVRELRSTFRNPDTGIAVAALIEDTAVNQNTVVELMESSALPPTDAVFDSILSDNIDTLTALLYPSDYHPRILRRADVPEDPSQLVNNGVEQNRCSSCGNHIYDAYIGTRDEIVTVNSNFDEVEITNVSESDRHIAVTDDANVICEDCAPISDDVAGTGFDVIFSLSVFSGCDTDNIVHFSRYSPVLTLGVETDSPTEVSAEIEELTPEYVAELPNGIDGGIRHGNSEFEACNLNFEMTGDIANGASWSGDTLDEIKELLRETDENVVLVCANNNIAVGYEKTVRAAQLAKEEIPSLV